MNEPNLTGWYLAVVAGAVSILAVVVVVAVILQLARTIAVRIREVALALHDCRLNTDAMPDVGAINVRTHHVTTLLSQLRQQLGSIHQGGP